MKKLFFVFILSGILFNATAQIKVGILGGANQSTLVETNSLPNWSTIKKNYKWLQGFHGGLFSQIPINKKGSLVFEPAIVYFNKGRKYFQSFDTIGSVLKKDSSFKQQLNYIDIPLNLLLKFRAGKKLSFFIGGGPYVSFFFNGKEKSVTNFKDPSTHPPITITSSDLPVGKAPGKYTTMDYGATVTAGAEMGRVFIRASASQSLADMYQAANYKGSFKNQVISVSLGVTLATLTAPVEKKKVKDTAKIAPKMIKDRDGDGVPDKEDDCPKIPGTAELKGCPDSDGDGVPDYLDKCPEAKGSVSNKGCPEPEKDFDQDGVPDNIDKCPTLKGLSKNNGCPDTDSDGDYIPDGEDNCPTVPGLYRYHGCPIPDTDGDGLNDEIDNCPNIPGLKTNNGCPASYNEQNFKDTICYTIYFEFNESNLENQAYTVMQRLIQKMKANNRLEVSIKGYTDNVGSVDANNKLSADRANIVSDYLASFYINRNRMQVSSFGKQFPAADISDPAAQWKNRRVEICIFEKK